jgi:hypothetical protein
MNIFILSDDPFEAARDQCDRHVVKMALESAQILSTVRHRYGAPAPYKPTHANHPCVLWAGECTENYRWLVEHTAHLLAEYTARYGKTHAVSAHLDTLREPPAGMPKCGHRTPFTQCMPEQYRVPGDPIAAYRAFYNAEKAPFSTWKNREAPAWFAPTEPKPAPPAPPKATRTRRPKAGYIGPAR